MIKKNKWRILLSSLTILLPMVFGVAMWEKLPRLIAIHWGFDGNEDAFAGPLAAVLFMPLVLLAVHLLCIFITVRENGKSGGEQNEKMMRLVFWIIPFISLYASAVIYGTAFGLKISISFLTCLLLGVMFVVIGNYLPKCRRNRTVGIKVKWALANDENWNATHRFGGKVWVVCGILVLLCAFLPEECFMVVGAILLVGAALLPTLYSYLFYKKQLASGDAALEDYTLQVRKSDKIAGTVALCMIPVLLVSCLVLCFTGDITVKVGEDSFTVLADYYEELNVSYGDVESIEFREEDDPGSRINGFGTPRLLMGWFKNDELGSYTRYSYTEGRACIVLTVKGEALVLGAKNDEETKTLYDQLKEAIEKQEKEEE